MGIEPMTLALLAPRSANWANGPYIIIHDTLLVTMKGDMISATFEIANLRAPTISKIMAHGRYRYLEKFPS